jgi:hypothetical protein
MDLFNLFTMLVAKNAKVTRANIHDVYIMQRCHNSHTLMSLEYNIIASDVLFLFSYYMFLLKANNKLIVNPHYL